MWLPNNVTEASLESLRIRPGVSRGIAFSSKSSQGASQVAAQAPSRGIARILLFSTCGCIPSSSHITRLPHPDSAPTFAPALLLLLRLDVECASKYASHAVAAVLPGLIAPGAGFDISASAKVSTQEGYSALPAALHKLLDMF